MAVMGSDRCLDLLLKPEFTDGAMLCNFLSNLLYLALVLHRIPRDEEEMVSKANLKNMTVPACSKTLCFGSFWIHELKLCKSFHASCMHMFSVPDSYLGSPVNVSSGTLLFIIPCKYFKERMETCWNKSVFVWQALDYIWRNGLRKQEFSVSFWSL